MKAIFLTLFLFLRPSWGFALEAEIQQYDSQSYTAIVSSQSLIYLANCSRSKLKQFEWKVWEEHWSVRARIQPVANILVTLQLEDPFMSDAQAFIKKGIESSQALGGHILCMVKLKRDRQTLMVKAVSFRAYRQIFISGNQNWEKYLNEIVSKELPLTLEDFKAIGKSK